MEIITYSLGELAEQCDVSARHYSQTQKALLEEPVYSIAREYVQVCDYVDMIETCELCWHDISRLVQCYQQLLRHYDIPIRQALEQYIITSWDTVLDSFQFDPSFKLRDPVQRKMLRNAVKIIELKTQSVDDGSQLFENIYTLITQCPDELAAHLSKEKAKRSATPLTHHHPTQAAQTTPTPYD